MLTPTQAHALYDMAGYAARETEAGVIRAYPDHETRIPVGLVVIRDRQVTYAEHAGLRFVTWPSQTSGVRAAVERDWANTVLESTP